MLTSSTGYKTSILGPHGFADIFNGGTILIYASARPLTADMPPIAPQLLGQVVVSGSDAGLQFAQNGPYITAPLGAPWQLQATASGAALWFRLVSKTDSGAASVTDPRIDGDVGSAAGVYDFVLQTTALVAGTSTPVDSFLFTIAPYIGV
jgi:hypothetical protein